LAKDINLQIQEVKQTPNRISRKDSMLRQSIMELVKIKKQKKIPKANTI
jgi:hypothetical protein